VSDLEDRQNWTFQLPDSARKELLAAVQGAYEPDKPLFDYVREDFPIESTLAVLRPALAEAHHGFGVALVRGLPREGLSEQQFELMNWALGLHSGVARPQGRMTQYISPVRDAGTDYRAATGRGYSSSAELDFHVDGADLTTLGCYNQARSGGQSMITSSVTAYEVMQRERPDLAELMCEDFYFSRQGEEAPDEPPYYGQPIFERFEGGLFTKWNRNRVLSAQKLDGVAQLTPEQHEAMDLIDDILRRPELMFSMYLQPGDLQIINNYTMLHSRTEFVDFDEPPRKRLLSRLWLAPPDSIRLPESWGHYYRSTEPGAVRGGIRGHHYDAACEAFERRQAAALGMSMTNGG
jgi:hypothetical protein